MESRRPRAEFLLVTACPLESRRVRALFEAGVLEVRHAAGNGFGDLLSEAETTQMLSSLREKLHQPQPHSMNFAPHR